MRQNLATGLCAVRRKLSLDTTTSGVNKLWKRMWLWCVRLSSSALKRPLQGNSSRSCTCTLRIIPSARESGKIPPVSPPSEGVLERSNESNPFAGLTYKPPCAACEQSAAHPKPPPPVSPEPMPQPTPAGDRHLAALLS